MFPNPRCSFQVVCIYTIPITAEETMIYDMNFYEMVIAVLPPPVHAVPKPDPAQNAAASPRPERVSPGRETAARAATAAQRRRHRFSPLVSACARRGRTGVGVARPMVATGVQRNQFT